MSEIVAAILGALLAGPAGFLFERFLSRPRITLSYARIEFEDEIVLTSESHQNLKRLPTFIDWADAMLSWNFKRSALANFFTLGEARMLQDLGTRWINDQKTVAGQIVPLLKALNSDQILEVEKAASTLTVEYLQIYNRQVSEDYRRDPAGTVEQLKRYLQTTLSSIDAAVVPMLSAVVAECQHHLDRGRGTSDRLVVRVGMGNRGIQDGLIAAEASLQAAGHLFKLPIKLTKRPWHTEGHTEEQGAGALDSNYLPLPARSFRVVDFLIDEDLNARAALDKLRRELRKGTSARFTAYDLGGHKVAAAMKFEASLPDVPQG